MSARYQLGWWFACARCGCRRFLPRNPGNLPVCDRCYKAVAAGCRIDRWWTSVRKEFS